MVKLANFIKDEKFIDGMIERHDALSEGIEHHYIIVSTSEITIYKYIKKIDRIEIIHPSKVLRYLTDNHFNGVLLHSFYTCPSKIIARIPSNLVVFWMGWGFDFYNKDLVYIPLYHPLTKKYIQEQNSKKSLARYFDLLPKATDILERKLFYSKALQRVDYFSGVLPIEYDMLYKTGKIRAKQFQYSYTGIKSLTQVETIIPVPNEAKNILIGNSCDKNNNHLDVFEALSNINIEGRKIILPLSYPRTAAKYRDYIIHKGLSMFGRNSFEPITEFLVFKEYSDIVKSCGYCIFMHERQQSIGNVGMSLILGSKVFLSKTSVVYNYYKSLGIHLFTIQDDLNEEELNTHLSQKYVNDNVRILSSLNTLETETEKLNNIRRILESNIK